MAKKFQITAELMLQTGNVKQVISNLKQQFNNANVNFDIKQVRQYEKSLSGVGNASKKTTSQIHGLAKSLADATERFTAITLATATFVKLARTIKDSVGEAIRFEREMVKIAQATNKTLNSLEPLSKEISNVSKNFGVSSTELVLAARTLTQAGFAANKVKGTLNLLAKTELAATFDSIQDTTEGVIAVLNQFGKTAQKSGSEITFLENALSSINQVSKQFAVESSDLITAIRTTGSAFESAGGSLDELLGLFTSVRATTRESAESISTGFRTIFTRVQRVDTINRLKDLGIELQDASGKFIGPIAAIKKLSTALNSIDPRDFRFNVIVEELGGFRQVSKVIPLIQQFTVAQDALNVSQKSSGSLAKDAVTAQQSLAVQISKLKEEFNALVRDFVKGSVFQSVTRSLLKLASAVIKVADSLRPALPLITTFLSIKAGQGFLSLMKTGISGLWGGNKAQGKNSGGKIHHFARGGFVPGTGNGDTVPAMLEPGEFVIRKSSVKKLGAGNLARVNKYAEGGVAEIDATKPYIYESKITQEKPEGAGLSESIKQGVVEKKGKKLKSRFGPDDKIKADIERVNIDPFTLIKGPPTKKQINAFNYYAETKESPGRYLERGIAFEKLLEATTSFKKDKNSSARIDGKIGDKIAEIKSVNSPVLDKTLLDDMIGGAIKNSGKDTGTERELAKRAKSAGLTNKADVMDLGQLIVLQDTAAFDKKKYEQWVKDHNKNVEPEKFALGGPAEKFKSARAITIPRPETYTYDKPTGADVDQKSPDGKMYKVNALDRLDYNRVNHLVDIDKEKVPADLKELYNKAKPDDRGGIFEKILLSLGKVQSLSAMQNARLDAISHAGNPSEVKSRIQQMNNKEFEEKLWGAIVSNADGSLAEMAMRERMNSNRWTQGDDVFNVGTVEVFEDVTRGLGREINAQEIKTDLEIQQARQQKELSKAATANARAKLQAAAQAVIGNNNDNYLIKGEATKPLSRKNEIYANTIAAIRRTLNIEDMADFWPSIAQMSEQELEQAVNDSIQRRASGGFIEKFANGGFSSGTDTVPAMLTPGEFVINKKSAQKIGYSKLNRMNKVGKYATGGVVQGFNIGGGVSKEKLSSMTPEELKSIGYLNDPNITKFLSPSSHSLINILANSSSAIPNLGALIKANKVNFNDIKNDLGQLAGLTSFSNITPPEELYSNVYGPAFSALISELGFDSSELQANNWTGSVFSGADNSKLIKILRSKIGKEFSYGATGIPATNSFSPIPNYEPNAIDSVSFQITPSLNQFGKMKGIGAFDKANGASLMLPMSNFLLDDVTKIKDSVVLHLTQKGTEISKTADTLTSQYGPKHENAANAHELLFMMQGKNALKNYSQIAAELMNEYGKKVKQDYDNFLNPPQKPDLSAVPSIDISSVYGIPKNKKELIAKYVKGIQLGTSQELQDFGAVPISYGSDVDLSNKNLTRYTEEEIKAIAAYVSGPNATVGGKPVNSPFGSGGINSTLEYIAKGQSDKIPFDDAKKQKAAELAKLLDSAANKKSYIPEKIYSGIHQMRLDDVLNQLFSGDILKQAEWTSKKFKDSRKAFKALSSASPIGKTFSISSFLSTSRDDKVAKAFSSDFNNSALLEIATKRSKLNRNRNIFLDSVEREHILPRNSQFKVNGMREHNGRIIFDVQQLAKGGSVFQAKGTDTVPAMLTPGEFVINKKSAEKIGYSNLNRMNKVGKYAKGGVVNYLKDGGFPESPDDPEFQKYTSIMIKAAQNLSKTLGVSAGRIFNVLSKMHDKYGQETKNMDELSAKMRGFIKTLKSGTRQNFVAKEQELGNPSAEKIISNTLSPFLSTLNRTSLGGDPANPPSPDKHDEEVSNLINSINDGIASQLKDLDTDQITKSLQSLLSNVQSGKVDLNKFWDDIVDPSRAASLLRDELKNVTSGAEIFNSEIREKASIFSSVTKPLKAALDSMIRNFNEASPLSKKIEKENKIEENKGKVENIQKNLKDIKTGDINTQLEKNVGKTTDESGKEVYNQAEAKLFLFLRKLDTDSVDNFINSLKAAAEAGLNVEEVANKLLTVGQKEKGISSETASKVLEEETKATAAKPDKTFDNLTKIGLVSASLAASFGALDTTAGQLVAGFGALYAATQTSIKGIADTIQDSSGDIGDGIKGLGTKLKSFSQSKVLKGKLPTAGKFLGSFGDKLEKIGPKVANGLSKFADSIAKSSKFIAAIQSAASSVQKFADGVAERSLAAITQETERAAKGGGSRQTVEEEAARLQGASTASKVAGNFASTSALAGGTIGSIFGPIGTAAGLAMGAAVDYIINGSRQIEKEFTNAALVVFDSAKNMQQFDEMLQNADKYSTAELSGSGQKSAADVGKIQATMDAMVQANYGQVPTEGPAAELYQSMENQLKNATTVLGQFNQVLEGRVLKQMDAAARSFGKIDFDKIVKPMRDQIKAQFGERIKKAKETGDVLGAKIAEGEQEVALQKLTQGMREQEAQIYRQLAAQKLEIEAREALIGSLNKERAYKESLEKFNFEMEGISNTVDNITKGASGDFGGVDLSRQAKSLSLAQSTPEQEAALKTLELNMPGGEGANATAQFKDLQKVSAGIETALNSLPTEIGSNVDYDKFFKDFFGAQGVSGDSQAISTLTKLVESTLKSQTGKESGATPGSLNEEAKKQIIEMFKGSKEQLQERLTNFLTAMDSFSKNSAAIFSAIAESGQRVVDIQVKQSEAGLKFEETMAKLNNKPLSLETKEAYRSQQYALKTGGASTDPQKVGKELKAAQDRAAEIQKNMQENPAMSKEDINAANKELVMLGNQVKNSTKALNMLADQSDKTANILAEYDRLESQRQAVVGENKQYTFASNEERRNMDKANVAAQRVAQTGNIESIPEELRGAVSSMFDQFKDVAVFRNKEGKMITGEEASKEAQKTMAEKRIRAAGGTQEEIDAAKKAIDSRTTPQEKLVQDLAKINAEETAARQELMRVEKESQDKLVAALDSLGEKFDAAKANILTTQQQGEGQIKTAEGALQQQGIQPATKVSSDKLLANAEAADSKAIEARNRAEIAQNRLSEGTAEGIRERDLQNYRDSKYIFDPRKYYYANGGAIQYRAGGGSMFKPKGTDTVPAMLTPGEFVVRKSAVDKVGVSTLNKINSYSNGGPVYLQGGGALARNRRRSGMSEGGSSAPSGSDQFKVISDMFNQFTSNLMSISEKLNGMTMNHTVTVDGQINIAGFDAGTVARAITEEVTNMVIGKVKQMMGDNNNPAKNMRTQ